MYAKSAVASQYRAALAMLEQAVAACPASMWNDKADRNRFWHVAYHAVFYTHLYLHESFSGFVPWEKHRQEYARFSGEDTAPCGREDVLAYLAVCRRAVDEKVPSLDLAAPSGFHWLRFDKLELQLYNLRHLQQHTGELMERLGARAGVDVDWVAADQSHSS